MEKINNAVFYNIGTEEMPEYTGGVSIFKDNIETIKMMGGGNQYDKYVVPFSLASNPGFNHNNTQIAEDDYSSEDEDDNISGGANQKETDIPVISGGMFDKLFNMVGYEINNKGNRKTQKKK